MRALMRSLNDLNDHFDMLWEITQATIAMMVVGATLYAWTFHAKDETPAHLEDAFFLVFGYYFGRSVNGVKRRLNGGRDA